MNPPSPLLPGIILHQLVGSPASSEGIQFFPALFEFEQEEGRQECRLEKSRLGTDLKTLMKCDDHYEETLLTGWVRARIPAIFGFQPPRFDSRPKVLGISFLAVPPWSESADLRVIPFDCTDCIDGPGLVFRSTETDSELKGRMAEAFWNLLAYDPFNLHPFEELIHDECNDDGPWKEGFSEGRYFTLGLNDFEEGIRWDEHASWCEDLPYRCPDCDGTGVEDWFPYTEDCLTCGGTGGVTWGETSS